MNSLGRVTKEKVNHVESVERALTEGMHLKIME